MPLKQTCWFGVCGVRIWLLTPAWQLFKVKGLLWLISTLPAPANSAQLIPN